MDENESLDPELLECGLFDGISDMVTNGYIKNFHLNLLKKWFSDRKINF